MSGTRNAILAMQEAVRQLPSPQRESVSSMAQNIYSIVTRGGEDGMLALAVVTAWLANQADVEGHA